ncbi:M56 family metallopeptidase, partial [Clostridium phoceensis]|uniref:M56 family metallopeptidase n=2 Tax=Clostridium phoceensis TaxID=1650661 RepID=UPI0023F90D12
MFDLWSFLHQTAAASMAALFVLVLQHIFRDKLSPQWQYAVWMVVVLRLILPVGWLGRSAIADLTGLGEALRTWVELGLDSAWSSPWTPSLPLAGIPIPPAGGLPRSVTDWLFLLYLAGVLLSALWLAAGGLRLRRSLGEAVPVAGARLEAVAALAERFGLSMPRRVVESRAASTPFLVGVVRPVLVLPMGWAPDRKVILHELIHLKQRDVAAGWVTALFRCVHWCNPFLWRIFDRIDNQREQRCDQLVLERLEGEDRRDYGRVLLSMADDGRRRFPGATTMANGGQNIKARIQAITRFKAFPRGMGLVSVCMVVTLTLSLVVGLPVSAADPLPGAVRLLGPVGSLSYALSHRPATVGGALDAYSKGIYAQYHDVQDCYAYQAMTLPQEQLPDLVEEWRQTDRAGWSVLPGTDPRSASYRTGPIFRGLSYDGEGGYWTQMYFFRDEGGPREGTEHSIGYRRHTLHLQRREDGTWTVSPLSVQTGRLASPFEWEQIRLTSYDNLPFPSQEPPVFTWHGEADGVELELWPEAELRVQDAYIEGSAVKKLDLNGFGSSIHTDAPDLDARFTSVVGGMVLRLTNHTNQPKTMTLDVTQYWDEGVSVLTGTDAPEDGQQEDPVFGLLSQVQNSCYTGYDVSGLEVELAPGESRVLYWGSRGKGYANRIPAADCVMADWLEAV